MDTSPEFWIDPNFLQIFQVWALETPNSCWHVKVSHISDMLLSPSAGTRSPRDKEAPNVFGKLPK